MSSRRSPKVYNVQNVAAPSIRRWLRKPFSSLQNIAGSITLRVQWTGRAINHSQGTKRPKNSSESGSIRDVQELSLSPTAGPCCHLEDSRTHSSSDASYFPPVPVDLQCVSYAGWKSPPSWVVNPVLTSPKKILKLSSSLISCCGAPEANGCGWRQVAWGSLFSLLSFIHTLTHVESPSVAEPFLLLTHPVNGGSHISFNRTSCPPSKCSDSGWRGRQGNRRLCSFWMSVHTRWAPDALEPWEEIPKLVRVRG